MNLTGSDIQYEVNVSVVTFPEIFAESPLPLALDTYQRPFVWGPDKVEQLINDLKEFIRASSHSSPRSDYYMGAVLLHEDDTRQRRYIIDGQQRITSLCVLYHVLTGSLPSNHDLRYHSPESVKNIRLALERCHLSCSSLLTSDIFAEICFTVISVSSQDLAFTFFDTQNNRGVPLNATDLLKAYHLRAINGEKRLELQTRCAEGWERLQGTKQVLGKGADFAPTLFHHFLWRARRWSGRNVTIRESFDQMIQEFQYNAIPSESPDTAPLYPCRSNSLGSAIIMEEQAGYRVIPQSNNLNPQAADFPFAIRQPISEGIGFFLYADKYADLTRRLLHMDCTNRDIVAFRKFYTAIIADLSIYIRELFLLACVMFVDQFGFNQLFHFSLWLDHVLGSIRIEKQYIFREAPRKFLSEAEHNLLDVIAGAFRPEEVIMYLRGYTKANDVYGNEEIESGAGVRGRYKQQVLGYFGRQGNLRDKAKWIDEDFIQGKMA